MSDKPNLNNWSKISKGMYRIVTHSGLSYEIHIISRHYEKDILDSKANLYVVEDRDDESGKFMERRLLMFDAIVSDCIVEAGHDAVRRMEK